MAQKKYLDYSGLSAYDELIKDYVSEQKHTYTASEVTFDNTGTSMTATNVQAAIVELEAGGGSDDSKMDKENPTGTGSFSLNRRPNTTVGTNSFAEGDDTTASGGFGSHAEGSSTTASGDVSHAEGQGTTASGDISHAEGEFTTASGDTSHAEGEFTTASGYASHTEGYHTTANHKSQHVFGEYNVTDPSTEDSSSRGNYVEIVGNGIKSSARSNARTLDWDGNETLAGKLTLGSAPTNNMDAATKEYVDTAIQTNITAVLNASY